jgi:hypothetical protein
MKSKLAVLSQTGPFQGPYLLFFDTCLQEVVTSQLYIVFTMLPVLWKLICYDREFYYLILLVGMSFNKNNQTLYIMDHS